MNQEITTKETGSSKLITMSNALTRAGHGLTLGEKRVIGWAVATLDSRQALRPGEVPTTRILAIDFAEQFQIDPATAYSQLQAAGKKLFERKITFYEPAYKRGNRRIAETLVQMRWVGEVKYHKGEGWIQLAWWPKLLPHLTGIKRQFTTYQLQQASALRSVYSWKLLELLMRFKSTGVADYSIEDFAASMDATEKQRADFAAMRRKMIEPAIKELTDKDGWDIDWVAIKAGRKVKALRFKFRKSTQGRLDV